MKRIRAVVLKEFLHILRDPTSLTIVFLMPVIMILVFGYSITFDLNRIDAGVIDFSQGKLSSRLIKKFSNNRYFHVRELQSSTENLLNAAEDLLKSGRFKEIIIIPGDFSRRIQNRDQAEIRFIIDGSDSNVANLIYQYNEMILLDLMSEFQDLSGILKLNTKIYFNPELKSSFFFIPGLIAILLLMISALLTSLSISREKESGSIELIFISPLKSPEIIIGKTIPYILVALADGMVILLFSRFWFGIPIRGSLSILFLFSLLYIITGLSLGILISTVAPSQKTAMFAALLITLLPSIMLSGFIFPLNSLAPVLQWISHLIPATYFLKIIRGVVLKGARLEHFITDGVAMVIFSIILLTLSGIQFSRSRKKKK